MIMTYDGKQLCELLEGPDMVKLVHKNTFSLLYVEWLSTEYQINYWM